MSEPIKTKDNRAAAHSYATKQNNQSAIRPMGAGRMAMGMGSVEKSKHFKKTWGQLLRYSKPFLLPIFVCLFMVCVAATMQVIAPSYLSKLTNVIKNGIDTGDIDLQAVLVLGIVILSFYGVFFVLRFVENFLMAKYTQKISQKMRTDISTKINRMPLGYFMKMPYGDLLSRVTNDVDNVGQTLNQSIDTLLIATTMFIGSLVMMILTSPLMALSAIGASLLGFLVMMLVIKKSQKYFVAQQAELGAINGLVEEIYTGHTLVKSYNASKSCKQQFESINQKIYRSAWKSQFLSGLMMPFMSLISNLGYISVVVSGALLHIQGKVEIGAIVAFMLYVRLFTQPLAQFAQAANALQGTAASAERVFEFLGEKEQADEQHKPDTIGKSVQGEVEFRGVKFGYLPEKTIIKDFSLKVLPGQKVAIVGPTGAGKTTLINLLMRFYELDGGQILIDGVDIQSIKREGVHDLFDMVLQESWIFEGSILQNIVYSKTGVAPQQVLEACQTVGLGHFVESLPQGLDTILGEKVSLSEGQKQLLTIARAIIKNSPLLILDEATSSVDTRTEKIVQKAMDELTRGRTSFVIAHRLSTIKNADVILVLKDGDIIEQGTHTDLLLQNGFYASLYNAQFETA
ncbi:MAG: ABC transporter ATP-binding protein/permease [Firmicutes bacterium]|nr:ABC transporter ATP-binding protein/permease [Bacillota bacterium]